MNKKKIIYSILKEIEKGDSEPRAGDYEINQNEFGNLIDLMQNDGLIIGATVTRGGMGHNVQIVFLNTAKITMRGLDYLEENSTFAKTYRGLKEIKSWLSFGLS
jgi:acyl CoA:acetate/3-ketoacid CoA transferase alpha subunit